MNILQFYEKTGGDYAAVLSRLGSEAMIKRFVLKFANDPSFAELTEAFKKKDAETAFRAAHTLKGVCLNLGFDGLFQPANALTENLRPRTFSEQSEELYNALAKEYHEVLHVLAEIE